MRTKIKRGYHPLLPKKAWVVTDGKIDHIFDHLWQAIKYWIKK